MQGGEYLHLDVLIALWQATERALEIELSESKVPLQDFLKARNSRWRLVGRVHFNLAENRRDQDLIDQQPHATRPISGAAHS